MNIIIKGLIFLIFFVIYINSTFCDEDLLLIRKPNTICYKLKFEQYDTLIYLIESNDSIIINYEAPLTKIRKEKLEIVCDSVSPIGSFILKLKLIDFHSFESKGNEKNKERKTTPWLNRVSIIEIDSLGNRIANTIEDTTTAGLCPGGAFQPYLLFPFYESCKNIGESWIVEATDVLVENGIPVPVLKYSSFFRAKGIIDTLGEKCNRFEYIKTGQGSYELVMSGDTFLVTNVVNGYGKYDISNINLVPLHYFATIEQKLTLNLPNGSKMPGLHFISSDFTLIELKRKKK